MILLIHVYLTWDYQKYIKQLLIDLWGEIDSTTIIGTLTPHLYQCIDLKTEVNKEIMT